VAFKPLDIRRRALGLRTIAALALALCTCLAQASEPAAASGAATGPSARWDALKSYAATLPETHRIGQVNAMFNTLQYRTDMEMHGVADYWDTPREFVERGAGDCEDFAIAKYFMLLDSGVSPDRVKLAFVHYAAGAGGPLGPVKAGARRAHMVVLYRDVPHADDPLVLDLIDEVAPLSTRPDLQVVFDFDARATYAVHDRTVSTAAVERKMAMWVEVLQRGDLVARSGSLRVAARATMPLPTHASAGSLAKVSMR
jgi:predicted transglutaminase-like cysteine proteinase